MKLVPYAEGLNEEKSAKMNRPRAEKGLISRPQEEVNLNVLSCRQYYRVSRPPLRVIVGYVRLKL